MTLGIYQIRNGINGKIYIGSCSDELNQIEGRIEYGHFYRLRKGTHPNPKLQYAWNKYGEDNFSWSILQELTDITDILDIETEWINKTGCYKDDIGYNIAKDALAPMKGRKMSDEAKKKIGDKSRGKKISEEHKEILRNRIVSEDTKKKIREARSKQIFSEEHKINFSRAQYKRQRAMRGEEFSEEIFQEYLNNKERKLETKRKPMSDIRRKEWKQKLRDANLGKRVSEETKQKMRDSQRKHFDSTPRRSVSEESKKRMSEAQKKRFEDKNEREKIWKSRKS